MPSQQSATVSLPAGQEAANNFDDRRVEEALAALHRAVSTRQFYPANHPLLQEALKEGLRAWSAAQGDPRLSGAGLRLRSSSFWLAEAQIGEGNPLVMGLAKTFANHGLVGVTSRSSLSADAFSQWVSLLATAPERLSPEGGVVGAWKQTPHGASLDLQQLAVATRRTDEDREKRGPAGADPWGQGLQLGADMPSLMDSFVMTRLQSFQRRGPRERKVLELLLRLSRTDDMASFLDVLQEIVKAVREYCEIEGFREAYHVLLFLYREAQNMEAVGSAAKRDYLLEAVRQVLRGAFLQWLINFVVAERGHEEAEVGEYILRAVGKPAAVPLINSLVMEKDRLGRKRLIDILVSMGESVIPLVIRMLDDQRWFVVRNMVTILGGIGTPESLRALSRLVKDPDSRIRREVVRAAGRVADPRAEEIVLALLADSDPAVRLMAISAATVQRSPRLLGAVWSVFQQIGIRLPEWNLKVQIVQALGRMGVPEGADRLEEVIARKPLFWRRRWEAVQVAAVQALGELGGEKARAILEKLLDHRNPELRRATVRALAVCGDERVQEDPCQTG